MLCVMCLEEMKVILFELNYQNEQDIQIIWDVPVYGLSK